MIDLYSIVEQGPLKISTPLRTQTQLDTVKKKYMYTGLFISPSGISEIDCATTKTDTAERSISIGRESLKFFLY